MRTRYQSLQKHDVLLVPTATLRYSCYAMLCVMVINRYHRQSSLWAHEAGYSATSGSLECNNGRLPLGTRFFSVEMFFKLHFTGFCKESSNVQMLKCYTCFVFWVSCGVGVHVMPRDSHGGRGVVASLVGHLTSRLHFCQCKYYQHMCRKWLEMKWSDMKLALKYFEIYWNVLGNWETAPSVVLFVATPLVWNGG